MRSVGGGEAISIEDKKFFAFNAVVSVLALSLLTWLLLIRGGSDGGRCDECAEHAGGLLGSSLPGVHPDPGRR